MTHWQEDCRGRSILRRVYKHLDRMGERDACMVIGELLSHNRHFLRHFAEKGWKLELRWRRSDNGRNNETLA